MIRILMIDDDIEVLTINKKFFEEKGCIVEYAGRANEGLDLAKTFIPDVILLDVMLPDLDGFTVCREMRRFTSVPILFLSGKISEEDKIEGFDAGGDDYVEKPYYLRELYVRILAHVRRWKSLEKRTRNEMIIYIDPFSVDLLSRKFFYNDQEIQLSNKEFDLVLFLAQNPGKEFSFKEIGIRLWGTYMDIDRRNVMVYVSRLRKKIESKTGVDNLIETVWSKGYKLVKP